MLKDYVKVIIILVFCFLYINLPVAAQNTYTSKKDSDPKAKAVLEKLKKQYDAYKTMEVGFTLELELPGKATEIQNGSVIQDGKKYLLKMKDQEIYCDTKSTWLYLKKNKEVQINDYDETESSAIMSPKQVLNMYEKGEYIYAIIEERKVSNQRFTDIEFKPVSKKSEFSKMRLTVDKNSNKLISLRVFSKDGSKYTLKINDIKSNKKYDPALFTFNPKAVTGVHIEDLRVN